ncbi:MAG: IS630 family transposase [Candidatus Saccharimonadales bacterium]
MSLSVQPSPLNISLTSQAVSCLSSTSSSEETESDKENSDPLQQLSAAAQQQRKRKARGKYHPRLPDNIRTLICELSALQGKNPTQIVDILKTQHGVITCEKTVLSVLRTWRTENRIEHKLVEHRRHKYTEAEEKALVEIQNRHNDATYAQLRGMWKQQTGSNKKLSDAKIYTILQQHNFSTKNLVPVPVARNTPEAIHKRYEYCVEAITWPREQIVFIDETGFDKHMHRRRGRSKKGTLATYSEPTNAGGRVNVCAAVKHGVGLLAYTIILTSWNQKEFAAFMTKVLSLLPTTHWIVVDGVKWHHTELVKEVFEGQKIKHHLKVLPPYSPHLNAIEYCFHVWKSEIKSTDQTTAPNMQTQIEHGRHKITADLVNNCLNHVYQYYGHCLKKQPLEAFQPIKPPGKKELKRRRQQPQSLAEQVSDV